MPTPTQLIDLHTIIARTGMSRMTVYRRMNAGEFPKPMKLSAKMNRWREADLHRPNGAGAGGERQGENEEERPPIWPASPPARGSSVPPRPGS